MSGYIGNIPVPQATQTRESFTATASQTTFNTAGYTPNFLDVFLNGVHLLNGTDYTATNGSDVVLTTGAAASDVVEVISYSTYEVNAQTYTGGLTVNNDGATVLTVDRATSDGSIVDFKKSGTTVGSIGSNGGSRLYIESGDVGLRLLPDQDDIRPSYNSGASRDAAIDLGDGLARFKDLYLSGGVYLGGTGAANYLEDYEEGTWTPTAPTGWTIASQYTYYVKVGNLVTVKAKIFIDGESTGSFSVSGLPFTGRTGLAQMAGPVMYEQISFGGAGDVLSFVESGVSRLDFWYMSNSGGAWTQWTSAETTTNTEIYVNATYVTNT